MCMYDTGDGWDVSSSSKRTARKEHTCAECGRWIKSGERYEYATGLYDGNWLTIKTCGHCLAAREWLNVICGGFLSEGVEDDLLEHKEEDPPISTPELSTLCEWMRTNWTDQAGDLRSVASVESLVHQALTPWRRWGSDNPAAGA